jgi:hypothetical protein
VTNREEGVSVNCEFTLICESDPEADDEDEESDGARVEAESRGDVGVGEEEVEGEEIAEAEVILEEDILELLPTDDWLEEAEDEDEDAGAPAPAGGNLSSASLFVCRDIRLTTPQSTQNNQHPNKYISDTAQYSYYSHWRFSEYVQSLLGP